MSTAFQPAPADALADSLILSLRVAAARPQSPVVVVARLVEAYEQGHITVDDLRRFRLAVLGWAATAGLDPVRQRWVEAFAAAVFEGRIAPLP